jgi:cytochrome c-type biogenesis protein CcmE
MRVLVKPKHQRLLLICSALVGLGIAASLILIAFQDTLVFFYSPSDLLQKNISPQQRIRVGGLVEIQSTQQRGEKVHFRITDQKESLSVSYQGLLPDLFKEGQGVVAEGYLMGPAHFQAETVLAKHDETYMPKEVAEGLKEQCK